MQDIVFIEMLRLTGNTFWEVLVQLPAGAVPLAGETLAGPVPGFFSGKPIKGMELVGLTDRHRGGD